jgi:hypothetical protein
MTLRVPSLNLRLHIRQHSTERRSLSRTAVSSGHLQDDVRPRPRSSSSCEGRAYGGATRYRSGHTAFVRFAEPFLPLDNANQTVHNLCLCLGNTGRALAERTKTGAVQAEGGTFQPCVSSVIISIASASKNHLRK